MQKGKVLKIKSFGTTEFFRKNYFLIIVFALFLIGVIIGVFGFKNKGTLYDYSENYISDFLKLRNGASFGKIMFASVLEFLASLFVVFLLGASLFGVVTVPALVLIKGIICGGVNSYLYSSFAVKGIAFNAVILIPSTLILLIVLLIAARESMKFSIRISSLTLAKTLPFNLSLDFKNFLIKYIIFASFSVLSGIIDAMVSTGLLKHFSL